MDELTPAAHAHDASAEPTSKKSFTQGTGVVELLHHPGQVFAPPAEPTTTRSNGQPRPIGEAFGAAMAAAAAREVDPPELAKVRRSRELDDLRRRGVGRRFCDVDIYKLPTGLPQGYYDLAKRLVGLFTTKGLIGIVGPRGTGKSALSAGLVSAFYQRGLNAWRRKVGDLLDELQNAPFAMKERIKHRYVNAHLLVLDEAQERDDTKVWGDSQLTLIVDARYEAMLPTVLISNQVPEEFKRALGGSITRRLIEEEGIIEAKWPRVLPMLQALESSEVTNDTMAGRGYV
jgi:DNA replication protein DnaC